MTNTPVNTVSVFEEIRRGISGIDASISTPYHQSIPLVYADWTASGRMYEPIERRLIEEVYPLLANTHTETNFTGKAMTTYYHHALQRIKQHVNASETDCILCEGTGMTGAVNKFQRLLGLKLHENFRERIPLKSSERPIVFVTHMEHHSNHISWLETIARVEIIPAGKDGLPDLDALEEKVAGFSGNPRLFASVTAASNVTGIQLPYYRIAAIMHRYGGKCFVDFACAAPYVDMNMHPENPDEKLDAIFFSPHKFLGGPGSCGVLIFDRSLYGNRIPDHPGGGTVAWTSPYRSPRYLNKIEEREDGGTPGFLQAIRTAMAIALKEQMGTISILEREHTQLSLLFDRLEAIDGLTILEGQQRNRLGVISFTIEGLYHSLAVRMLNDRFGIQVRGGCSCAGTYGHFLFGMDETSSNRIIAEVEKGNAIAKPGWIRLSIHPSMTDEELIFICDSIEMLVRSHREWSRDYVLQTDGTIVCNAGKASELPDIFRNF